MRRFTILLVLLLPLLTAGATDNTGGPSTGAVGSGSAAGGLALKSDIDDGTHTGTASVEHFGVKGVFYPGDAFESMPSSDATPDISSGSIFNAPGAGSATVTDFDAGGGSLTEGHHLIFRSGGGWIFDCTGAGLFCGTTDIDDSGHDITTWIYDGTDWRLTSIIRADEDYSSPGIKASGGTMTGDFIFQDNVQACFGSIGCAVATIDFDGSDFNIAMNLPGNIVIDPTGISGYTDIAGGLFVSEDEDVYSRFGAAPITSVTDTLDRLVLIKNRDATTQIRRALFASTEITSNFALANNGANYGMNAGVFTDDGITVSSARTAGSGGATGGRYFFRHRAAGDFLIAGGVASQAQIQGDLEDGTVTEAYAYLDEGGDGGNCAGGGAGCGGGITDYYGFWAKDVVSGSNVANKYGIFIEYLTNASSNSYGIRIDGADTYALWLANTSGTANDGIQFGTDTNLYRSAANELTTDDDFVAASVTTAGTITGKDSVVITTGGSATATMLGEWHIADATAGSDTTYTLPDAAVGLHGCFQDNEDGTGTVILTPASGDHISLAGVDEAADATIANDGTNGHYICLLAVSDTEWLSNHLYGTWSS